DGSGTLAAFRSSIDSVASGFPSAVKIRLPVGRAPLSHATPWMRAVMRTDAGKTSEPDPMSTCNSGGQRYGAAAPTSTVIDTVVLPSVAEIVVVPAASATTSISPGAPMAGGTAMTAGF